MKDIFRIRKMAKGALTTGIVSLIIASWCLAKNMEAAGWIFAILGLLMGAAFFVLGALWWRCPHCRRGFELRWGPMDKLSVCPYCGKKLR